MKQKHVLNCQLPSWYPSFKNVTFRSKIMPLQDDFVEYLNQDGIVLPSGANDVLIEHSTNNSEDDSDSEDWSQNDESTDITATAPAFDDLTKQIEEAIESLGGAVFPKLNWSSPRDATWISYNGTLKCTSASDIFLLLKSSDRISHDINQPFRNCEDEQDSVPNFVLVLRKWHEVASSSEFRCFVRKGCLVGISQRDTACHYPYIAEFYTDIIVQIKDFFAKKVVDKFPDSDYVFDVFLQSKTSIKLVDFNPFGTVTDSLLFTWEELCSNEPDDEVMFRFVTSGAGVQPSPFLCSRVPRERFDLATSDDINKMVDFLKTQEIIDTRQNSSQ